LTKHHKKEIFFSLVPDRVGFKAVSFFLPLVTKTSQAFQKFNEKKHSIAGGRHPRGLQKKNQKQTSAHPGFEGLHHIVPIKTGEAFYCHNAQ